MRYVNAAFWAKAPVPLLGYIPFNVLAVTAFGLLGFGEHALWLLGMGLETAYLFAISTNTRFQKVVDAQGLVQSEQSENDQRASLIKKLNPAQRRRLAALETKVERIFQVYADQQVDDFTVSSNRESLRRMSWIFLKLLIAQRSITESSDVNPVDLHARANRIEQELQMPGLTRNLRESKEATLRIIQQRLTTFQQRKEANEEIESDLGRIEAEIDLALESASLQGRTEVISANIQLSSSLLSSGSYGDLSATVSAMDRTFETPTILTGSGVAPIQVPDEVKAVLDAPGRSVLPPLPQKAPPAQSGSRPISE